MNSGNEQSSENLKATKKRIMLLIVKNFSEFDKVYSNIKSEISLGYVQSFLNLIKTNTSQNDLIESPFYLLGQRCNYIKGKYAFACNRYKEALTFFIKSREQKLISDAKIIKSSVKKIKKILKLLLDKLELKENSEEYNETKKKQKDLVAMHHRQKTILEKSIENLNQDDKKYTILKRDYMVLINISSTMKSEDAKRIKRTRQNILHIFDNFVADQDRFSLFFCGPTFNPVINLSYKNETSNEYIKSLISNITNLIEGIEFENENVKGNKELNLLKILVKGYEYMSKKCI